MSKPIDIMIKTTVERFSHLLEVIPPKLKELPEAEFSLKPSANKWSKKEILGHLVDSAANNHHRFIRAQYEELPLVVYDQNQWNRLNQYQELSGIHIIMFWELYNRHLLELITRMPVENYKRECRSGEKNHVTLEWLIDDYLVHMEHHLKQIVDYA